MVEDSLDKYTWKRWKDPQKKKAPKLEKGPPQKL